MGLKPVRYPFRQVRRFVKLSNGSICESSEAVTLKPACPGSSPKITLTASCHCPPPAHLSREDAKLQLSIKSPPGKERRRRGSSEGDYCIVRATVVWGLGWAVEPWPSPCGVMTVTMVSWGLGLVWQGWAGEILLCLSSDRTWALAWELPHGQGRQAVTHWDQQQRCAARLFACLLACQLRSWSGKNHPEQRAHLPSRLWWHFWSLRLVLAQHGACLELRFAKHWESKCFLW